MSWLDLLFVFAAFVTVCQEHGYTFKTTFNNCLPFPMPFQIQCNSTFLSRAAWGCSLIKPSTLEPEWLWTVHSLQFQVVMGEAVASARHLEDT